MHRQLTRDRPRQCWESESQGRRPSACVSHWWLLTDRSSSQGCWPTGEVMAVVVGGVWELALVQDVHSSWVDADRWSRSAHPTFRPAVGRGLDSRTVRSSTGRLLAVAIYCQVTILRSCCAASFKLRLDRPAHLYHLLTVQFVCDFCCSRLMLHCFVRRQRMLHTFRR